MFNRFNRNYEEEQKSAELFSVIKNDRPYDDIIIWRTSKEDFNNNTQLIVMESEEALFVKDA